VSASSAASTRRGVSLAFAGAVLSACFVIPWKIATEHGDPTEATLVLLVTAAVCNTLAQFFVREQPPSVHLPQASLALTLRLALVFAVLSLAGNYCSAAAVQRLSGPLLSVLLRCEVLVVALLGALLLGEHVARSYWTGTAIAGVGLVVLSWPDAGSPASRDANAAGVLFGLGSALCFGTMIVLTRKFIARVRPVFLNATRLWLGVLLWFLVQWRVPTGSELAPGLVLGAALAGFFGPFLSRLCAIYSARHVTAATTALLGLAAPPLTLLLTLLVVGTWPSAHALLGGRIMLLGICVRVFALLSGGGSRRPAPLK
jgi:drug/metabolite transporter (DMT)-like permease